VTPRERRNCLIAEAVRGRRPLLLPAPAPEGGKQEVKPAWARKVSRGLLPKKRAQAKA
jgi:hypothetical protein